MFCTRDRGDHMADVLLSLKHAVVHPHQVGIPNSPPVSCPSFSSAEATYHSLPPAISNDCSFLASFSPQPSSLELPSSILGDSLEDSLIPRDTSTFNLSCLVSPTRAQSSPSSANHNSSPSIFTQLTSSPPPPQMISSPPNREYHVQESDSCHKSLDHSSPHFAECLFSPVPLLTSSPNLFHSLSPPNTASAAISISSDPLASAFTPVLPLPSFVHPRTLVNQCSRESSIFSSSSQLYQNVGNQLTSLPSNGIESEMPLLHETSDSYLSHQPTAQLTPINHYEQSDETIRDANSTDNDIESPEKDITQLNPNFNLHMETQTFAPFLDANNHLESTGTDLEDGDASYALGSSLATNLEPAEFSSMGTSGILTNTLSSQNLQPICSSTVQMYHEVR